MSRYEELMCPKIILLNKAGKRSYHRIWFRYAIPTLERTGGKIYLNERAWERVWEAATWN